MRSRRASGPAPTGASAPTSHDYELADGLQCPYVKTQSLAATKTRLERMPDALQERLINWGYSVCDAAIRKHVDVAKPAPQGFPYPDRDVG